MSTNRAISKASPVSGATFTTDVADTTNALAGYLAGVAVSPSGTNTYTFTIEITNGFTGPTDGMGVTVKVPNTNTGAVQFNVASTGNKAVAKANGDAFTGGELVSGTVYTFVFLESDDEWRLVGASSGSIQTLLPYQRLQRYDTPGSYTFTAPYNLHIMGIAQGAAGSGAQATNGRRTGGAGGAQAVFYRYMEAGEELDIVVGAGGAGVVTSDGNPGGTTTVSSSSPALSVSAGGGEGGNYSTAVGTTPAAVGGTATGGDQNYPGGDSGTVNINGGVSGGGSAPAFADGVAADDVTTATGGPGGSPPGAGTALNIPWLYIHGSALKGADGETGSSPQPPGAGAGSGGASSGSPSLAGGDGFVHLWYTNEVT